MRIGKPRVKVTMDAKTTIVKSLKKSVMVADVKRIDIRHEAFYRRNGSKAGIFLVEFAMNETQIAFISVLADYLPLNPVDIIYHAIIQTASFNVPSLMLLLGKEGYSKSVRAVDNELGRPPTASAYVVWD